VRLYWYDGFNNMQYLVSLPYGNDIEWEATFDCDVDGYQVINGNLVIVIQEQFLATLHLDKGHLIQINNLTDRMPF